MTYAFTTIKTGIVLFLTTVNALFSPNLTNHAYAMSDTVEVRETAECELGASGSNFFELDAVGEQDVIFLNGNDLLSNVRSSEFSISYLFETYNQSTGQLESRLKIYPICNGAETFTEELEKIWAIRAETAGDGTLQINASDISETNTAKTYGISLTEEERKTIITTLVPIGKHIAFRRGIPTPPEPDIHELGEGFFRFDYKITATGKNSRNEYETEIRKFRVYVRNQTTLKNELKQLSEESRRRTEAEAKRVADETISLTSQGGVSYTYHPSSPIESGLFGALSQATTIVQPKSVCPEDTNEDGVINIVDLVRVGRRFGEQGETGWVSEDIRQDGEINIIDLVMVGRRFGESCPQAQASEIRRSVFMRSDEIPGRLTKLNDPFNTTGRTDAPSDSASYVVESGSGKVLISAPHSANQIREGKIKDVDYCTGAIAKLLKEQTGAHLIYFPYQGTDPNYYDDVPYKQALGSYLALHPEINLVLDIHGADRSRAWDIDLGFMNGKSLFKFKDLPTVLGEIFKANGIGTISNNFFAAEFQHTVTGFVAARNKDAIQIEINRNYRCDEEGRSYKLVNSLYQIIEKYK